MTTDTADPETTIDFIFDLFAKRYLCATDDTYLERLSDASINSLMVQGGPMNTAYRETLASLLPR
jgi:predicted HD phosphohydrolase